MSIDSNIDNTIDCSIPCFPFFKIFNSCPTRPISLELLINNHDPRDLEELFYMIVSVTPYLLSFVFLVSLILYKTSRLLLVVIMCFFQNFIVEILKNALKDPRPNFNCNKQYGNPSNHAVYFSCLIFWNFMEWFSLEKKYRYQSTFNKLLLFTITPFIIIARYKLKYHTIEQLINGVITGAFIGVLWFITAERIFLNGENSFSNLFSKLGIQNNMSDYEIVPQLKNSKGYASYKKYEQLMKKQEEMSKLSDHLKNFKNSVEKIDFINKDKYDPDIKNFSQKDLAEMENLLRMQANMSNIKAGNTSNENNFDNINDDEDIGDIDEEVIKEYLKNIRRKKE